MEIVNASSQKNNFSNHTGQTEKIDNSSDTSNATTTPDVSNMSNDNIVKDVVRLYLRNELDFWNVHGIMNTSGLLQS